MCYYIKYFDHKYEGMPGSSDDIDSITSMEQTSGSYPEIQLSRGGKPRLRRTKT